MESLSVNSQDFWPGNAGLQRKLISEFLTFRYKTDARSMRAKWDRCPFALKKWGHQTIGRGHFVKFMDNLESTLTPLLLQAF